MAQHVHRYGLQQPSNGSKRSGLFSTATLDTKDTKSTRARSRSVRAVWSATQYLTSLHVRSRFTTASTALLPRRSSMSKRKWKQNYNTSGPMHSPRGFCGALCMVQTGEERRGGLEASDILTEVSVRDCLKCQHALQRRTICSPNWRPFLVAQVCPCPIAVVARTLPGGIRCRG